MKLQILEKLSEYLFMCVIVDEEDRKNSRKLYRINSGNRSKGLANVIKRCLQKNNVNCQILVGQCYDGASIINGYLLGAREHIKKRLFNGSLCTLQCPLTQTCVSKYLLIVLDKKLYWYRSNYWNIFSLFS